jgi:hypothetical protein
MQPPLKSSYYLDLKKTNAVSLTINKRDSFLDKKQKRNEEDILLVMDNRKFKEKLHTQLFSYSTCINNYKYKAVNYHSFEKSEENYVSSYKQAIFPEESPRGGLNILLATRFNTTMFREKRKRNKSIGLMTNSLKTENDKVKNEGIIDTFYDRIKKNYDHSDDCLVLREELRKQKIKHDEEANIIKEEDRIMPLKNWIKNNFYSKHSSKSK